MDFVTRHVARACLAATFLAGTSSAYAQPYVYTLGRVSGPSSQLQVVTVINAATGAKGPRVQAGTSGGAIAPHGIAISPDGLFVFVVNDRDASVTVISTATNTVVDTIGNGLLPANPFAATVSPDSTTLYVSAQAGTVTAIDLATRTRLASIATGRVGLGGIVASPDGARVYASSFASHTVTVISVATYEVIGTIALANGSSPYGMAVSKNSQRLYVALLDADGLAVVDTSTNTLITTIALGGNPIHAEVSPDGTQIRVLGAGGLRLVDPVSNTVTATTPVPSAISRVAFTPDGAAAYVSDGLRLYATSTTTNSITATIQMDTATEGFIAGPVTTPPPYVSGPSAAPTGLTATAAGSVLTMQWAAPAIGAPLGYVIEGGLAPGTIIGSIPTGSTTTSFVFSAPTGTFHVRVRALRSTGVGPASNEVLVRVNMPVPPSAPTGLLGLVDGSTLALAWKNTEGGGAASALILDVSGAFTGSLPLGLTDTFAFVGVPPGTYTFVVRATNSAGSSPASAPVTLTFPSGCSGVPGAPVNFDASRTGSTISVSWDLPATGPAPTNYTLIVGGAIVASLPVSGRVISGPVPAGTYTLSVVAMNACGQSVPTPTQSVTVP